MVERAGGFGRDALALTDHDTVYGAVRFVQAAKGFHFVTLEDEDGFINVIVSPQVYGRYRQIIRRNPLLVVEGIVQHEGDVINLVAGKVTRFD